MTSPGGYLIDLATRLEGVLADCNRRVSCVDLAFGSSVTPPQLSEGCDLKVDVGPSQNPFRAINLRDGSTMYTSKPNATCARGNRFTGIVRVTGPYDVGVDCCHEHSEFTYLFTNTVAIVHEAIAVWLEEQDDGESVQTEYVTSYNGGAVTVGIIFSMRLCIPSCQELLEEESLMIGVLDAAKEKAGC